MSEDPEFGRAPYLSTLPARSDDRRFALVAVLASIAIFFALAPFAKTPLGRMPAFIPIYQSALVVTDLITAILLFGQYRILRAPALAILASGYLFTAVMTVAHTLTFPGLFVPTGLLGAGAQSTAWIYMFWHAGFPLFVVAYAVSREPVPREAIEADARRPGARVLAGVVGVFGAAAALVLLATTGQDLLPAIMQGQRYTPSMIVVVSTVWAMSPLALVVLWRRRPHSVLDLWLMVVLCAWLSEIALSAVLNHGRFDLGFYAGRIFGLLASSFVLLMLLLQNTALYAQLAEADYRHRRRLAILHEIDRAVATERDPETIASGVIEPLRELLGVARAIVNVFDLDAGEVEWLAAAGRHRTHVGPGVRYSIELMGDVEALKRGESQIIDTYALPAGPERDALLASGVELYMAMPMIAGGELVGAISFGDKPGPFAREQVTVAREVATQLAIALVQARLYKRVKYHAAELEHIAYYDRLTALPNRNNLYNRLREAIRDDAGRGRPLSLLLMDLAHFKEVNVTLGYSSGDLVLKEVGRRLRSVLFEPDVVASLGGDVFAVLLPHLARIEDVELVVRKIEEALHAPVMIAGLPIAIEAAIGVALYPDHGKDPESLLQRADVAMYAAKRTGSSYIIYGPEHDQHSAAQLALMAELREAIERDHLVLHYQPTVELKNGKVSGAEALVRWMHPQRGLIPPDQFIGLAERTGMIHPLTQWVLQTAICQCAACNQAGFAMTLSVNLSARNLFDPNLPDRITRLLQQHKVTADCLAVEITESAIMVDPSRAAEILSRIHGLGIQISIDDFGAGYSSLSYLRKLPVDRLKVDKSFVINVTQSEDDAAIVRSTIELAHSLGLEVVAEGVESKQAYDRLVAWGCDTAQGYYISKPLPIGEFTHWLYESPRGLSNEHRRRASAVPPRAAGPGKR
jgi:diguanylate cyclase (GGDEF)-like protein